MFVWQPKLAKTEMFVWFKGMSSKTLGSWAGWGNVSGHLITPRCRLYAGNEKATPFHSLWLSGSIRILSGDAFVLLPCVKWSFQMPLGNQALGTPGLEYKRLSERLCAAFPLPNSEPGPGSSTAGTGGRRVVLETWLPVQNKPCFKIYSNACT